VTRKSFLLFGASDPVSARPYRLELDRLELATAARAGSHELRLGRYGLKVEGHLAVLTCENCRMSFGARIRIDDTGKKFRTMRPEITTGEGVDTIQGITLDGSTARVVLGL